jgi:hypothetical protein
LSWFRYHADALDNPKIQSLPAVLFKFWVNLLCVSKKLDGFLPDISEISFRCRCSEPQAREWLGELKRRKLIDELQQNEFVMHDWNEHQFVSDDVTSRVRKHRAKRKGNVSETPPEQSRADTEQTQSRTGTPEWAADAPFAKFATDYRALGASVIDEDFIEAYRFGWKPLDWEQKADRVKALTVHSEEYRANPRFIPSPVKFLKQEWKRPLRPAPVNGSGPPAEPPEYYDMRKARAEEDERRRKIEERGFVPIRPAN